MPMWDEPNRNRSTNVPMYARKTVPCLRCGRDVEPSHGPRKTEKSGVRGICNDCRMGDPEYVRALNTGEPLVDRHDDTVWEWAG